MKASSRSSSTRRFSFIAAALFSLSFPHAVLADGISADAQGKIAAAIKQLEGWAANPTIVGAVKESNGKGGIPGMNNGKWDGLDENDPLVQGIKTSPAGKLLVDWDKNPGINKLYLRDEKANLIAGSNKALRYNNVAAPQFASCIKGAPWSAKEVKPDPTTGVKSVQVCVPVLDGGKPIGVMNSAVTIDK